MSDGKRLDWLDLVRGVASLVVVAFHFGWAFKVPAFGWGYLAVDLFFVLSGVVLTGKYEPRILGGMTFLDFSWRRLRRLYPMLPVMAAVLLAANALGMPASPWSVSSTDVILALPLLLPYSPTFGSGTMFPADSPVWSLWAEIAANAVWFFALRGGKRLTNALFLACAIGFVALLLVTGTSNVSRSGFDAMGLALLRALTWFGVGRAIVLRQWTPNLPPWACGLLIALGCFWVQRVPPAPLAQLLVVAAGAMLLARLAQRPPGSPAFRRICCWLGRMSYPLYLSHMFAARLGLWVQSHGVRTTIAYAASFLLVTACATLLNEWIVERLPSQWPPRRRADVSLPAPQDSLDRMA